MIACVQFEDVYFFSSRDFYRMIKDQTLPRYDDTVRIISKNGVLIVVKAFPSLVFDIH